MARMIFTGKGPTQPINADAVKEWKITNGDIYLVCDGIGHNDKTLAAVNCFVKTLHESTWGNTDETEKLLINNILNALKSMSPDYDNLSFCCCVAMVFEKEAILAHCGDCRVGYLTEDGVKWLTKDDVPALSLYRKGKISKESYDRSRHLISTKLKVGSNNLHSLKVQRVDTSEIQNLLLCSDGFWSESEELLDSDVTNVMNLIHEEIERLEKKSEDNFSVVIV